MIHSTGPCLRSSRHSRHDRSVTDAPEDKLLAAARQGDGDALQALLERYQPRIYGFGMKMCRNPDDAQDVLQETLLAVARSVRDFRGASSVSTWLYTIARSFCIKKRRRSKFAPGAIVSLEAEEASALSLRDPGRAPDETVHDREMREALERAIGALEAGYREVLVLRDVEGLSAAEVGEVLGLSVEAVKSRLHRARTTVRKSLLPHFGPAPQASATGGCPDIVRLFSHHLEGDISPSTCAEMERHLASCDRCRSACNSLKDTLRLCRTMPEPGVPPALRDSIREGIKDILSTVSR